MRRHALVLDGPSAFEIWIVIAAHPEPPAQGPQVEAERFNLVVIIHEWFHPRSVTPSAAHSGRFCADTEATQRSRHSRMYMYVRWAACTRRV